MEHFERLMLNSGYRLTKARRLLLHFFVTNKGYFKAEMIYDQFKKNQLGIATIYRNLKILKELDIITCLSFEHNQYYTLKKDTDVISVYAYCKLCEKIYEYEIKDKELSDLQLKQTLSLQNKFEVEDLSIKLKGICEKCR
jgi:Fe2+ or Zn2+ uptake regulation protein